MLWGPSTGGWQSVVVRLAAPGVVFILVGGSGVMERQHVAARND